MTIHLPENLERSLLETVRSGRFASLDDAMAEAARLLINQVGQGKPNAMMPTASQEDPTLAERPIWEEILEMTADIPEEEWDKLPTDLAEQHDHYIYGIPKRPAS